jgi:hypothetical protein
MGVLCGTEGRSVPTEGLAMSEPDHRELGIHYFNAAWDLIDLPERTPEQSRDLLTLTMASRQHWIEAGATAENSVTSDWQVAHAASLCGFADVALTFARAAAATADESDVPDWLVASAHEGLARAYAGAGDRGGYDHEVALTRTLLAAVASDEDRELVASQLASIPPPD